MFSKETKVLEYNSEEGINLLPKLIKTVSKNLQFL